MSFLNSIIQQVRLNRNPPIIEHLRRGYEKTSYSQMGDESGESSMNTFSPPQESTPAVIQEQDFFDDDNEVNILTPAFFLYIFIIKDLYYFSSKDSNSNSESDRSYDVFIR